LLQLDKKEEEIMKTIITFILSFLSLSLLAQNVSINFAGANRNREYQVVIDGISYYSKNSVNINSERTKSIAIPNLETGTHELSVYNMRSNNNTYSDGNSNNGAQGQPIYSKSFQLRDGYDMTITVRPNGMVSFGEKRAQKQYSQGQLPMSSTAFNQLLLNVRNSRYQSDKLKMIRSAFNANSNSFTTSQVRQLLLLVNSESQRLELAKLSYGKLSDPANFSYAYDVFTNESLRQQLDDYIVSQGATISSVDNNAGFGTAMSNANFNEVLQRIYNQTQQQGKVSEIASVLNSYYNYFTTAQIKQLLSFVSSEEQRLDLAKQAFSRVSDRNNFNQLVDLFYVQSHRDELNNYIVANGGYANTNTYKAPMSDASFNQIYSKARNHFFQKNTLNEIRTAFSTTTNNFTTDQVRKLLLLARTDADKLALAKLGYKRTVDPINYSQLLDLFTIQSNQTELDIFIKAQQ
jgi:hypothetical protein